MAFDLSIFESEPVLGIIRGVNEESVEGVVEASLAGGLRFLEITLNTPNPFHLIKSIQSKYNEIQIGAGTVLTTDEAKKAVDSGAKFIVAPNFEDKIAAFCSASFLEFPSEI